VSLSKYHQKYSSLSGEEIQKRLKEKEQEPSLIFKEIDLKTRSDVARTAVLGCADRRLIAGHRAIFEKLLGRPVEITTFDISIDHLAGEGGVVQHDCTLPLPSGPYDITYAHVLLKFIETEKQWDLIKNSYKALKPDGLAIHVMDKEDYETAGSRLPGGYSPIPLKRWKKKLDGEGAKYTEIPVNYGLAFVIYGG
jgi:hypothetical protein